LCPVRTAALLVKFLWQSITAFGIPVVPLVKAKVKMVSGITLANY